MNQLARNILDSLVRSKFITKKEQWGATARDAAETVAEYHEDDEEIGSSDMTFIMGETLEEMGKKVSYKTGRLKVVESNDTELEKEKTVKLAMPGVDQGLMAEVKKGHIKISGMIDMIKDIQKKGKSSVRPAKLKGLLNSLVKFKKEKGDIEIPLDGLMKQMGLKEGKYAIHSTKADYQKHYDFLEKAAKDNDIVFDWKKIKRAGYDSLDHLVAMTKRIYKIKESNESIQEEAKTEQELMADASRIRKELAAAQSENAKDKSEAKTAKVEAKKEQLKRVSTAIRNARADKVDKKKPTKNEANFSGSPDDIPSKIPNTTGVMKLAMDNIIKYPGTKWGNSDKKLQHRADLFLKENPKLTQNDVLAAFKKSEKLRAKFDQMFTRAKGMQNRYDLARTRNLFNQTNGMLSRAFKGNVWHDKPTTEGIHDFWSIGKNDDPKTTDMSYKELAAYIKAGVKDGTLWGSSLSIAKLDLKRKKKTESVESDFYGGKHDHNDRNTKARIFNSQVKLTDVPSQVMKIWKKMSHKQRLNTLSRLGFNYTQTLSVSRLIKKEVDALNKFARYYKANNWDKMKVLKIMTAELNKVPPPNKKTHILESKEFTKLAKQLEDIQSQMKKLAMEYRKESGQNNKARIVSALKVLMNKKKQLEDQVNSALTDIDKDAEFVDESVINEDVYIIDNASTFAEYKLNKDGKLNGKNWTPTIGNPEKVLKSLKQSKNIDGFIKESLNLVDRQKDAQGSSYFAKFNDAENAKVIKWLSKQNSPRAKKVLSQAKSGEKYSDSLQIKFGAWLLELYANYGIFRLGAGGNLTRKQNLLTPDSTKKQFFLHMNEAVISEGIKTKKQAKQIFGKDMTDIETTEEGNFIVQGNLDNIRKIAKRHNINIEDVEHWGIRVWTESVDSVISEAMNNVYQVRYHEKSYMFKDERITGRWAEVIEKAKKGLMKADAYRHSKEGYWATVEPFGQDFKSPDYKNWTISLKPSGGFNYMQIDPKSKSGHPNSMKVNKLTEG